MVDPLKKHLDKLKIIAESAKRRNNMYADLAKLDNRQAKRSLSALHNAPATGKKIQKIGLTSVFFVSSNNLEKTIKNIIDIIGEREISICKEISNLLNLSNFRSLKLFVFYRIFLCILWGAILNGFMNMFFTFTTRYLLASEVTFFMLLEFCLGPIWVWLFINEQPTLETIQGGSIIILTIAIHSFLKIKNL